MCSAGQSGSQPRTALAAVLLPRAGGPAHHGCSPRRQLALGLPGRGMGRTGSAPRSRACGTARHSAGAAGGSRMCGSSWRSINKAQLNAKQVWAEPDSTLRALLLNSHVGTRQVTQVGRTPSSWPCSTQTRGSAPAPRSVQGHGEAQAGLAARVARRTPGTGVSLPAPHEQKSPASLAGKSSGHAGHRAAVCISCWRGCWSSVVYM